MSELYDPYKGLYTKIEINKIRKYLKEELARSLKGYKGKSRPPVYYLSYLFRNHRTEKIWGRLGAVNRHEHASTNTIFCDLRVGTYRADNLTNGGLNDNSDKDESVDYIYTPSEISEDAFKYCLWKLTDARYREAAEQFFDKKSKALHFVDSNKKLAARLKSGKETDFRFSAFKDIDRAKVKSMIRKAGNLVKKHPHIKNSWFELVMNHRQHVLVTSEGREILIQQSFYELRGHVWVLSKKGEGISQDLNYIAGDFSELPDEKQFLADIKDRIELLEELEDMKLLNSYSGPVLLSAEAAGVFFHEVVGHRLEGSRLLSPDEGATFFDLRGKKIIPEYIDIVDDPTMDKYEGRKMIGHFKFDDEGNQAKRATLVEKGVLKNFLTTSAPVPGQKETNGHARNQSYERPISRMGNLMIINHKPIPKNEMWAMFLEEIKNQKKSFGIYVKYVQGGETDTSSYDFQAFKGEIMHACKVYLDGREEPIRGVDFVGTPLSSLDSVMCLGEDVELDNSFCGAESGFIPVSTVSPSMLMRNLELQSRNRERFTQYMIDMPYTKKKPVKKK